MSKVSQEDRPENFTCPECGPVVAKITDSRSAVLDGITTVRRRRTCPICTGRFTTYEVNKEDAKHTAKMMAKKLIHRLIDELMEEG